ncbi:hypothetical protein [Micromonospora halophytica]|uniref:Uncharacterized protein n=1 Tax=Micromonospora halophytica TaxID=47864 RepID=A0A1C5J088_9ACTN|nr:hypothetical protein GA0070560_1198 [Micromonospora halophytica]
MTVDQTVGDYPAGNRRGPDARHAGELVFLSTIATFGTPLDVTLAELSIESFYPADGHTASVLRGRARR